MSGPSDPQFQKLVTERVAAGNPEPEDSPTYLLKRLTQDNTSLRQKKRSRPEDAAAELKELVIELYGSTSRALQTFRRSVPWPSTGLAR